MGLLCMLFTWWPGAFVAPRPPPAPRGWSPKPARPALVSGTGEAFATVMVSEMGDKRPGLSRAVMVYWMMVPTWITVVYI